MALVTGGVLWVIDGWGLTGWQGAVVTISAAGGAGLLVYGLLLWAMHLPEARQVAELVTRRLKRAK